MNWLIDSLIGWFIKCFPMLNFIFLPFAFDSSIKLCAMCSNPRTDVHDQSIQANHLPSSTFPFPSLGGNHLNCS